MNIDLGLMIKAFVGNYMDIDEFLKLVSLITGALLTLSIIAVSCIHRGRLIAGVKIFTAWLKSYSMQSARMVWKSDVKYLLLISLPLYTYLAITAPLTHDEALTHSLFLTCPVSDTMMYYTFPNNHILFSLIAHVFIMLPGDLLFNMRLPVVLTAMLTLTVTYRFARKFYGEVVALTIVAVLSMSGMFLFYGFLARGYGLVVFFFAICLYTAFNIINENNRARDWIIFSMSGALGMYAVPSFMYAFAAVNIYILFHNTKYVKKQVAYGILMLTATFFLYLPVLLGSGLRSLVRNPYVRPISSDRVFSQLFDFFVETQESLFASPVYITITLILLSILFCIVKKDNKTLALWLIFCCTPILFVVLHSVIPFSRTFVYNTYAFVFLFVVTFRSLIRQISSRILLFTLITIQALLFLNFRVKEESYLKPLAVFETFTKNILAKGNSFYVVGANNSVSGLYYAFPNLQFETARSGRDYRIVYELGNGASADTISGYDYILIQSELDETQVKIPTDSYFPDSRESQFFKAPIHIYEEKTFQTTD